MAASSSFSTSGSSEVPISEETLASSSCPQSYVPSKGKLQTVCIKLDAFVQNSAIELTLLLLYMLGNCLIFVAGAYPEIHQDYPGIKGVLLPIARGFGYMLNLNCGLVLLPCCYFIITFLQRTVICSLFPFERMKDIHKLIAYVIIVSTLGHAGLQSALFALDQVPWKTGLHGSICVFVTGILLCIFLASIAVFAAPVVRNRLPQYEWFWYTHIICMALFMLSLILHGQHRGKLVTWIYLTPSMVLYVIDWSCRLLTQSKCVLSCHYAHIRMYACGTILKIELPLQARFQPGQFFKIRIPEVSNMEWHPFSAASDPGSNHLIFILKRSGDWTDALFDLVNAKLNQGNNMRHCEKEDIGGVSCHCIHPADLEDTEQLLEARGMACHLTKSLSTQTLRIDVQGPFSSPTENFSNYPYLVLIGAGIGATPMISVIQEILGVSRNSCSSWGDQSVDGEFRLGDGIAISGTEDLETSSRKDIKYWDDCGLQAPAPVATALSSVSAMACASLDLDVDEIAAAANPERHFLEIKCSAAAQSVDDCPERSSNEISELMPCMSWENDRYSSVRGVKPLVGIFSSLPIMICTFWLLLVRLAILVASLISHMANMSQPELHPFKYTSIIIVDLVISSIIFLLTVPFFAATCIAWKVTSLDAAITFLMSLCSILSVIFGSMSLMDRIHWSHGGYQILALSLIQLVAICILVGRRLYRESRRGSIKSRPNDTWMLGFPSGDKNFVDADTSMHGLSGGLKEARTHGFRCQKVDFIWMARSPMEDVWLLEMLAKIPRNSKLRLWRCLTGAVFDESHVQIVPTCRLSSSSIGQLSIDAFVTSCLADMITTHGRPSWRDIFSQVGDTIPTGSTVGVFACGNRSLSKDVRRACENWMVQSRQVYINHKKLDGVGSGRLAASQESEEGVRSSANSCDPQPTEEAMLIEIPLMTSGASNADQTKFENRPLAVRLQDDGSGSYLHLRKQNSMSGFSSGHLAPMGSNLRVVFYEEHFS